MGSPIRLFEVTEAQEVEVTTTAIQFLQSLVQPVALVTIIGPARSHKSMLAAAIAGRLDSLTEVPKEAGAWLWPDPIPVKSSDESGEHEFSLIVVEMMDIHDNSPPTQQILLITCMLSSHLICVSTGSFAPIVEALAVLPDLHTRVQIL